MITVKERTVGYTAYLSCNNSSGKLKAKTKVGWNKIDLKHEYIYMYLYKAMNDLRIFQYKIKVICFHVLL